VNKGRTITDYLSATIVGNLAFSDHGVFVARVNADINGRCTKLSVNGGNCYGDDTGVLDEVTNGTSYNGTDSRTYHILQTDVGYGFVAGHLPFANFSYSGIDSKPLAGGNPWNHAIDAGGVFPNNYYYYDLTN
jgi:hypothetical protein